MTPLITRRWVLAGGVLMALAKGSAFEDAAMPPQSAPLAPTPLDVLLPAAPDRPVSSLPDFDEYTW